MLYNRSLVKKSNINGQIPVMVSSLSKVFRKRMAAESGSNQKAKARGRLST